MSTKIISVIGCGPPGFGFMYNNSNLAIREIIAEKVKEINNFEPKVHFPLVDPTDFPDPEDTDAIIIGGSPLNPDEKTLSEKWMQNLLDFIRNKHGKKPMLGICFGHQAIAKALGADVEKFDKSIGVEIGALQLELTEEGKHDPLFKNIPQRFVAMFSHSYYVKTLPENGVVLARNETPSIQAFRVGDSTYGVQFHPDYTSEIIEEIVDTRKDRLEKIVDIPAIVTRPKERHDERVLKNFLDLVEKA